MVTRWTYNQVLQEACRSWSFPCYRRGGNLLVFNLLPNRVVAIPLPIASLEWGVATRRTHSPNTSWGLSALESYLAAIFDGRGQKSIFPGTAGKLAKLLNARRSRATWIANWVVCNIFLSLNFFTISLPYSLAFYETGQEQQNLEGPRSTDEGSRSTDEGLRSTDEGTRSTLVERGVPLGTSIYAWVPGSPMKVCSLFFQYHLSGSRATVFPLIGSAVPSSHRVWSVSWPLLLVALSLKVSLFP